MPLLLLALIDADMLVLAGPAPAPDELPVVDPFEPQAIAASDAVSPKAA
jgi:hypothetical protein